GSPTTSSISARTRASGCGLPLPAHRVSSRQRRRKRTTDATAGTDPMSLGEQRDREIRVLPGDLLRRVRPALGEPLRDAGAHGGDGPPGGLRVIDVEIPVGAAGFDLLVQVTLDLAAGAGDP